MTAHRPADWKNYEDFASDIATNRLPQSGALAGSTLQLCWPDSTLTLRPRDRHHLDWHEDGNGRSAEGSDRYEALQVASDTWFIDMTFTSRPHEALTVILNLRSRRVLGVRCRIVDAQLAAGGPRVQQHFLVGTLGSGTGTRTCTDRNTATGMAPHETRDLIGLRTLQTYSPQHTYEHTYLNSGRYAWQCLVGVQRGHGDVDQASYYQFDENQYVFTFREYRIPVASVFFFNFADMRSTGKFLGLTGDGAISNSPAGAFIRKVSTLDYAPGEQPA